LNVNKESRSGPFLGAIETLTRVPLPDKLSRYNTVAYGLCAFPGEERSLQHKKKGLNEYDRDAMFP
jgi:hypothetical protein